MPLQEKNMRSFQSKGMRLETAVVSVSYLITQPLFSCIQLLNLQKNILRGLKMNERKVLLFKKVCYDVGTRFSFVINGKIVETVIRDVMIDYHKNIDYEKQSVRYHFCTMDKHTFDEFSERELEDMIQRGIVLYIE